MAVSRPVGSARVPRRSGLQGFFLHKDDKLGLQIQLDSGSEGFRRRKGKKKQLEKSWLVERVDGKLLQDIRKHRCWNRNEDDNWAVMRPSFKMRSDPN